MSDLIRGYGELRRAVGATPGRHAVDEDAALTPIFHALSRGRPDEMAEFRRDPLTAPIPVQAFTAAATPPAARTGVQGPRRRRHAGAHHARSAGRDGGRHTRLAV